MRRTRTYLTAAYRKAQVAAAAVGAVLVGINVDDGLSRNELVQIAVAALGIGTVVGATRNRPTN